MDFPLIDRLTPAVRYRLLILLVLFALAPASRCFAQSGGLGNFGTLGGFEPRGQYPSQEYFAALEIYRDGDLEDATEAFEIALRRTRRDINGRWIDAIPVYAMLGECYWHLGALPKVRENVDMALQLAIRHRGWQTRVDWDSAIRQGVQRSPQQWLWPEAAAINRIVTADRLKMSSGERLTEQSIARGGAIEEFNIKTLDVIEIMRGLAIACYRKRILMGPLAQTDPLASEMAEAIKTGGIPQPIARSLLGCVRASTRFSNKDDKRALDDTVKYGTLGGGVHPLTPIALLLQASALAESDRADGMLAGALATVHASGAMEQPEWIGEALQLAAGIASEKEAVAVRVTAERVGTALARKSRLAAVHSFVAGADAAITAGDLDGATMLIGQAKSFADRRDVLQPRISAYGGYVAARLAAARGDAFGFGKSTTVDQAYASMQSFAFENNINKRKFVSMPSLYQMNLIGQAVGSRIGTSSSDEFLEYYSSNPPQSLWRRDPVDALAFSTIDRSAALNARLAIAGASTDGSKVLARSDALLAGRFSQTLPMAGRIASARHLARSEQDALPADAVALRGKGIPAINRLRQSVLDSRVPAGAEFDRDALTKAGIVQESLASTIALSRLSLPQLTPPRLDPKAPAEKLPAGTAMVTFAVSNNRIYTTFTFDGNTNAWISPIGRLPAGITSVLRSIGVGKSRGGKLPEDDSWRKDAATIMRLLFPEPSSFHDAPFDSLIIVPDGPLWYLPFELLPIDETSPALLGEKFQIRYAATPGLALQWAAAASENQTVGLVASRFFAPRELDINQSIAQSIVDATEGSVMLPTGEPTVPSPYLGTAVEHLIVAAPVIMDIKVPFAMNIVPYDKANSGATLGGWMRFPSQVPRSVSLAGFRSLAESGRLGDGRELFLTLAALQTAGVRDVLISRWAVGGESTAIALRDFAQELPFSGMAQAWTRAKMVLRRSDLVPDAEPLLANADEDREILTGEEPLFWSGYLLASPVETSP
ncbi:hypothetical protein [Planctomycetes bacterium CA13]